MSLDHPLPLRAVQAAPAAHSGWSPLEYQGLTIDAEAGAIYGLRGKPIGRCDQRGYISIYLRGRYLSAHRIIWEAANGPIPAGLEINHKNGNKQDNRLSNLELVTPSENRLHAYALKLARADGEFNGRALLDWEKVRSIRASSEPIPALAIAFGVSRTTIRNVLAGRIWKTQQCEQGRSCLEAAP